MSYYNILKYSSLVGGSVCGILVIRNSDSKPQLKKLFCENADAKTDDKDVEPTLKLKQVQLFFRHGARTPLHTIPNVREAPYTPEPFMKQVPHTLFEYNITTLDGGPRPYSGYENYLSTRFLKADYIHEAFSGQVAHTVFNFKTMTLNGGPKPYSGYDNYYAKNMLKGGSHVGTLTHLGQEQMYVIGKELRKQYIDELKFIDPVFNPEQIHVRSTNIHRTIRTARCLLAGMFGKKNLNELKEPPIIYVQDSIIDELLPRPAACKVLRQINHAAMIHGGDHPDIKEDRIVLENALGLPPDGTEGKKKLQFIEVRDDIRAREVHGFRIPSVLVPHLDVIEKNANLMMYFAFCGQHDAERLLAMRLSNGPLLRLTLNNIANRNRKSTKFYLYSCHDSSLVALLAALDIYDKRWPPFGADMRFEVYEDNDKQEYIKVSYCGEDKIVRGCKSEFCPLGDFKRGLEPYTIQDPEYKAVCASNILDLIAKEMMELEEGEVEDTETKAKSEIAAGM